MSWQPVFEGCISIRRINDTDEIIVYRQDGIPMTHGEAYTLWGALGQYIKLSPEELENLIERIGCSTPLVIEKGDAYNPGYVYLVECNDFYKIGYSVNVENRIKSMQSGSPNTITLIHTIFTNDMRGLEKELHRKFAKKRALQEWFILSFEDIDYIKSLDGAE